MTASALYCGATTHQRFRPRRHRLHYRMFQGLFDLDELDALNDHLRLFSRNRFNLFTFRDRDYGERSDVPLRAQVEKHLAAAGLKPDGGAIRVLTMPRILGHVFNPISTWFCHRLDGTLLAMIYEVTNTFGDRHSYLIPVTGTADGMIRQKCAKRLYVSPFMDMAMSYDFTVTPPARHVRVVVRGDDVDGPMLRATFAANRRELADWMLVRAFFGYPLLTLKVVAGIHFEAVRLWLKGIRVRRHPPPPEQTVTIGA